MNNSKFFFVITSCLFIFFLGARVGLAEDSPVLFQDDFENGVVDGKPNPVWNWEASFSPSNPYGMMYGTGDIYSSKSVSVGKRNSKVLSLNFDGRNGFCNTCGTATHVIKSSEVQEQCLSVSGGPFSSKMFNKDGGFSTWEITSADESRVCFDGSGPLEGSLFGDNIIETGDELKLPYQCGINGDVGGVVDRRSDCNLAINYLEGIEEEHFQPGMVLARRMYLYFPESTVMPGNGMKLGYTVFQRPNGRSVKIIPVFMTSRNSSLEVDGNIAFDYQFASYKFVRDKWHYLEEVWTRESAVGQSDGSYRLYAGEVGSDTSSPLLSLSGIEYGDIKELSIIGNWQHRNDAKGSIYIDNVMVANGFIGQGHPDEGQGWVSPPSAPELDVQ